MKHAFWLLLVSFIVIVSIETPRSSAQAPYVQGPFIGSRTTPVSVSGDLRRLPQTTVFAVEKSAPRPKQRPLTGSSLQLPRLPDAVRAAQTSPSRMPTPLQSFKGLSLATWGDGWPADPNGDVGPNHYIQAVNTSLGIFNKSGNLLLAMTFDDFFSSAAAPCNNKNQGDPIVLYDSVANRWLVSDFAWFDYNGPFYECIAVSKTADPVAGGWWQYAFLAHATAMNDYPKLGVWADGYYMSANLFLGGYSWQGVRVWALNRDDMLAGQPVRNVYFDISPSSGYGSLLPGNLRGALPPTGTPNFFASIDEPNLLHLWKFHVDWTNTANSTFSARPSNLIVPDIRMPCDGANILACVPQQGGESVDGLGDRLMMQLQYRNIGGIESLWATHTVANSRSVGTPTGVRWYEIRNPNGTPTLYQSGTVQPDANYRWMPSLAVDRQGNMAVGYSVSSASMYPAIRYSGRLAGDAMGQLPQGETPLWDGTGSQNGGYNRWGDYSAMSVDPVDDCTFWYTNMYYETTGNNWQTRIGSFRFPSCNTYRYYFPFVSKAP